MPDSVCAQERPPSARCAARAPTIGGAEIVLPDQGLDLDALLDSLGRALTAQALERSRGNISAAARLLGLNRTTLIERLRRWKRLGTPLEAPERKSQWNACE